MQFGTPKWQSIFRGLWVVELMSQSSRGSHVAVVCLEATARPLLEQMTWNPSSLPCVRLKHALHAPPVITDKWLERRDHVHCPSVDVAGSPPLPPVADRCGPASGLLLRGWGSHSDPCPHPPEIPHFTPTLGLLSPFFLGKKKKSEMQKGVKQKLKLLTGLLDD